MLSCVWRVCVCVCVCVCVRFPEAHRYMLEEGQRPAGRGDVPYKYVCEPRAAESPSTHKLVLFTVCLWGCVQAPTEF